MTTDPCGGDTRGGDGCRCDPPFTTTPAAQRHTRTPDRGEAQA